MRFAIEQDKPYLISGGKAYPVELTENHGVKISISGGDTTDLVGTLTLEEMYAKAQTAAVEVAEQGTAVFEVTAADIVSKAARISLDGTVTGTLFPANIPGFSTVKEEQYGYYLPVKILKKGTKVTILKDGKERTADFPDDDLLVVRIPGPKTTVSISVDDNEVAKLHFEKTTFSGKKSPAAMAIAMPKRKNSRVKAAPLLGDG